MFLSFCHHVNLYICVPIIRLSMFLCFCVYQFLHSCVPSFLSSFYLFMFLSFFFRLPCLPVFIVYIPLFVSFCVFVFLFSRFPIFCHPRKKRSICSILFLPSYPNIIISSCLKDFFYCDIFFLYFLLSFILILIFLSSMILFFFFHVFMSSCLWLIFKVLATKQA